LKVRRRGGNSRQDGVAALLISARTVSWAASQSNHPKSSLHMRQQRQQKRCDSKAQKSFLRHPKTVDFGWQSWE